MLLQRSILIKKKKRINRNNSKITEIDVRLQIFLMHLQKYILHCHIKYIFSENNNKKSTILKKEHTFFRQFEECSCNGVHSNKNLAADVSKAVNQTTHSYQYINEYYMSRSLLNDNKKKKTCFLLIFSRTNLMN